MDCPEVDFEKARFEYVVKVYENLIARKDSLERKAILQLLIVTLMLGFVFLNIDSIRKLNDYLLSIKDLKILFFSNVLVFVLSITLILALILIIVVLFRFKIPEAPSKDLLSSVYFPDSENPEKKGALYFYQKIGVAYTVAIESAKAEINKNESLIRLSTISLTSGVLILGMLIIAYIIGLPT
jgi:hypothetical protein